VRPGKKKLFENGLSICLLDGRLKKPVQETNCYSIKVVESLSPEDGYDLFIVSVRHYQLEGILPLLRDNVGKANILFFSGNWEGFDFVDKYLPRSQYLWGYPVAGGGFTPQGLNAALLENVQLGEIDGSTTPRLLRIQAMFAKAEIRADIQKNMLHWLWVHFAINCGIIASAFKAGGATDLLNSIPALRTGILAGREALAVCAARGVDVKAYEDAQAFYQQAWLGAAAVWFMMKTNEPARKIMETHTAVDELQRMYSDLLKTGEVLNVPMPLYKSLEPFVDQPIVHGSQGGLVLHG
jgi:2-dehydropantoate 2-reductase